MQEFLDQIAAFPTVLFTVLLAVVSVYWMFVIAGAADVELLDAADGVAEGALEGAAEGAAEGIAEGAAEGAMEGLADGAAEGVLEGAAEGVGESADGFFDGVVDAISSGASLAALMHALKLRNAPVTVVLSMLVLWSWIFTYLGMAHVAPLLSAVLPTWVSGLGVMAVSMACALPVTSVLVRPMGTLFLTPMGERNRNFVGTMCTITTGKVTDRFGQAEVKDGGAGLLIQVRCRGDNVLKKGHEALIVDWNDDAHVFFVEAVSPSEAIEKNLDRELAAAPAGAKAAAAADKQGA